MSIASCLEQVRLRMREAEEKYGRPPGVVKLLAVSKSQLVSAIQEAFTAGQALFGENYIQEALPKMDALKALPLEWHFIGAVQSNKIKKIAEHFDWVDSVDSLDIAKRLNACRRITLPPLNICIEVNLAAEPAKRGIFPNQLKGLITEIIKLPRLCCRGLMVIPPPEKTIKKQREIFAELRQLWEAHQSLATWDVLSMGMSHDFESAIAEGTTLVRIGTAIFGERAKHV